jgi:hypothetical protein
MEIEHYRRGTTLRNFSQLAGQKSAGGLASTPIPVQIARYAHCAMEIEPGNYMGSLLILRKAFGDYEDSKDFDSVGDADDVFHGPGDGFGGVTGSN